MFRIPGSLEEVNGWRGIDTLGRFSAGEDLARFEVIVDVLLGGDGDAIAGGGAEVPGWSPTSQPITMPIGCLEQEFCKCSGKILLTQAEEILTFNWPFRSTETP